MNLIRVFVSCCCLATMTLVCHGQKFRDISKLKTQYLKRDVSQYEEEYKIPFKKIEVVDLRFDTSKIGYATYREPDNHTKFVAPGGLQNFLNKRLNEYFKNNLDPSSSQTLLIVVKKLWLEYESTNRTLKYNSTSDETQSIHPDYGSKSASRNTVCLADIDAFCTADSSYQAVARLTQDFKIDRANDYSDCNLLLMPFDALVTKIHSLDVAATVASRKKFSRDEIILNYRKRFDIPVLLADSLNRGIYLSFDDFKKNKPAYANFKFKTFEISTEVTIEQDGKEVPITEYWGFTDGKQLYVKPGFLPFRVLRQGNTFDFLGCIGGRNVKVYIPTTTPINIPVSTTYMYVFPMQVDMETGKFY
ncbi:MAG TPA: hypothetical protein VFI06_08270 [Chitinophagaceae bacterium]|nr:hypothetical protein [Chitinophagaceae bacterium]